MRLASDGRIDVMVRVRPHAAQSKLIDVLEDGSLKIAVAAPAEDGKGNAALVKFVGSLFNVPPSRVKILSGMTSRQKLLRIENA